MPGRSMTTDSEIRQYQPGDRDAMYDICLRTGAAGGDASSLVGDPRLMGEIYVGPYVTHAPDLAYVVIDDEGVAGYVLGALDSVAFAEVLERDWWPDLRARHPEPDSDAPVVGDGQGALDALLIGLIHHPPPLNRDVVAGYPSHLHIDLLPRAQGRGWGRRLTETLFAALAERGSPGVHLGVALANTRAISFYQHLGMTELGRDYIAITFGSRLPPLASGA